MAIQGVFRQVLDHYSKIIKDIMHHVQVELSEIIKLSSSRSVPFKDQSTFYHFHPFCYLLGIEGSELYELEEGKS